MAYGKAYITTQGAVLAAKTLQSKILKFSKFAVGSGDIISEDLENIKELLGLVNPITDFTITRLSRDTDTQVTVKGVFKNTDVTEAFYLKELGLFAIDSDTGEEVLFAYINFGDKAEYIGPSLSEKKEHFYNMIRAVDNSDNVTIEVNPSAVYVTEKELQEALDTKSNIPRRKTITLSAAGWTLNETTQKYEYRIDDTSITEDDDIDVRIEDEEQEELLADAEVRLYSYNGYYVFTAKELIEIDIEAELVITRTKLDTTEQIGQEVLDDVL